MKQILKVVFVIIGTMIGAGFASRKRTLFVLLSLWNLWDLWNFLIYFTY